MTLCNRCAVPPTSVEIPPSVPTTRIVNTTCDYIYMSAYQKNSAMAHGLLQGAPYLAGNTQLQLWARNNSAVMVIGTRPASERTDDVIGDPDFDERFNEAHPDVDVEETDPDTMEELIHTFAEHTARTARLLPNEPVLITISEPVSRAAAQQLTQRRALGPVPSDVARHIVTEAWRRTSVVPTTTRSDAEEEIRRFVARYGPIGLMRVTTRN